MKLETLCSEVMKAPKDFDFKGYLYDFVKKPAFEPYKDHSQINKVLQQAIEEQNDKEIIRTCFQLLQEYPFDIEAHALISQAAHRQEKPTLFQLHNFIASSILDVILESGDGRTEDSPYVIFHPKDIYALFTFLGKKDGLRDSLTKDGLTLDCWTFPKGEKIYIDISLPISAISGLKEKP